jgi:NADPH:quinone reductase-like Zn-dependent oxidoreductase
VGGDYFNKHLRLIKPKGTLIQIACIKGSKVEGNLALIMRKRIHIIGFILRAQTIKEKAKLWQNAHKMWLNSLTKKELYPLIDSEFTLQQIEEAHQYMERGIHFGKIGIHVG